MATADWACKQCAEDNPEAYADAVPIKFSNHDGTCEVCGKDGQPVLFVPKKTEGDTHALES